MSFDKINLPRLQIKRGPNTVRGKLHASRNAIKYEFTRFRTKSDQHSKLYEAIKHALSSGPDLLDTAHDVDAVATAILNAYRIRSEAEATTLKFARSELIASDMSIEDDLMHLEGLCRYERRARSRLMTLIRPGSDRAPARLSDAIRRIAHQNRRAS